MYCFKCGFQILDESLFCSKCGAAQDMTIGQQKSTEVATNKELDREAIKIYLSNLLSLECAQKKLNEDYYWVNYETAVFEDNNYNMECVYFSTNMSINRLWLHYDGFKYYLRARQYTDGRCAIEYESQDYGFWLPIEENWEFLNNYENWPAIGDDLWGLLPEVLFDVFGAPARQKAFRDFFLEKYSQFKKIAPDGYEKAFNSMKTTYSKRAGILKEIGEVTKLLKSAYDIDIIPQQFRNIYAIWFIHDYMTTSNESLSNALLHFNLDEIKNKLDTVIEQMQEIIINQGIQIAQNEQILRQNQKSLEHLAKIELNTERSAQYSQIAANNAEACAWIGLADYIR